MRTAPADPEWTFNLCGGHLALDFANTAVDRRDHGAVERLVTYGRLVAFVAQARVISSAQRRQFREYERCRPVESGRVLAEAIELREALRSLFCAIVRGRPPDGLALGVLNNRLSRLRLGPHLAWEWSAGATAPDAITGPIVRAAVDLVVSPGRARVHLCAGPDCQRLFLDISKNGSRRWCDMRQCGNRMKARRFYDRQRG